MHHGSDPALQGSALVLRGMVQSQEQYVTLLSIASPVRLRWKGECAELVLLVKDQLSSGYESVRKDVSSPSFLFAWTLVCPSMQWEDPCSSNSR